MKIRKELWFGFTLMAIILVTVVIFTPWASFVDGHLSHEDQGALGLLMLALIVVAIMLGFPTAFTLMGMGVFFGWLAYRSVNPELATQQILDLMVQRAYSVMSNDVLIAIPLFVFMGYLVERANLIEKLFKSLHLSLARVPGALAVATIVTCAIFATATGIVGAVVTLMGLLALPAMLRAGYSVQLSAGAITAGGCLGILIPPSVLLIVYGATAGVSVVKLYAGAFFPGIMLAALYVLYVIVVAKVKPHLAPPLERERAASSAAAPLTSPELAPSQRARRPLERLPNAGGRERLGGRTAVRVAAARHQHHRAAGVDVWQRHRTPHRRRHDGLVQAGGGIVADETPAPASGLEEPPAEGLGDASTLKEPEAESAASAPAAAATPPAASAAVPPKPAAQDKATTSDAKPAERLPVPMWYWITLAVGVAAIALISWLMNWQRLEIFKMLLTSFFPLAVMILAVLARSCSGWRRQPKPRRSAASAGSCWRARTATLPRANQSGPMRSARR